MLYEVITHDCVHRRGAVHGGAADALRHQERRPFLIEDAGFDLAGGVGLKLVEDAALGVAEDAETRGGVEAQRRRAILVDGGVDARAEESYNFV